MGKFSVLLALALYISASVLAVPEKTEHGNHGAEKHKPLHFKGGVHNAAYDYEALIGSRFHDEMADLPEEVRRNRLTVLAKSHDTNKNGMIETEELYEWILHSFKVLDHQEAEERRTDDDDNNDGKVTFGEILHKQHGYTEEEAEYWEKTGKSGKHEEEDAESFVIINEDKARFDAADLNKDGALDESEYVAYSQPYDFPHMHGIEIERAMKDLDTNKDGSVSMEEFVTADKDDEETRLSQVAEFEGLDKDKDGKLSSEEVKPWAIFDNKESAKDEVEHLIKECDADQDGHLSIEEIVDKEDDFISSQATDYGRHLHFVKDEL